MFNNPYTRLKCYQDLQQKYEKNLKGWDKWEKYFDNSAEYDFTGLNPRNVNTGKFRSARNFGKVTDHPSSRSNIKPREYIFSDRVVNDSDDGLRWFKNHVQNPNEDKNINEPMVIDDTKNKKDSSNFHSDELFQKVNKVAI